jgi:alkylation response protein AidB-like acyl-CoA dehydrogenase
MTWPSARRNTTDGTYPFQAIDALKAAGYFAAPMPVKLGGHRVASAHDLVVASSRLARGDASVAIGVNIHLVAVLNMERRRQIAVAAGAQRRARAFAASLEQIARDGVVLAAAISEPAIGTTIGACELAVRGSSSTVAVATR